MLLVQYSIIDVSDFADGMESSSRGPCAPEVMVSLADVQVMAWPKNDYYSLDLSIEYSGKRWRYCYDNDNSIGEYICKSLEPLGWEHLEGVQ